MEETFYLTGIVVKREDCRENDSRVFLYTKEKGMIELVARGTKKINSKMAAHLEPFNLVNLMVVKGRRYDYVGSVISEECFRVIKEDFTKVMVCGRVVGFLLKNIKFNLPDQDLFDLILDYFYFLEGTDISKNKKSLVYHFFILNFLAKSGQGPELYQCVVCGKKIGGGVNGFDFRRGGVSCAEHQVFSVSENCLKILRYSLENKLSSVLKIKINISLEKEVKNLVDKINHFQS